MNAAVLDKIRKLRALAASDNLNEAAAAAGAAARLIQEHNLAEADIAGACDADEPAVGEMIGGLGAQFDRWKGILLVYLARAYSCEVVYSRTAHGERAAKGYGRPGDLDTFRYQFAFFSTEITRLAERHGRGRGRTWKNSFRLGAVGAIGDSLQTVKAQAQAQASTSALAVVDRRAEAAKLARERADGPVRNHTYPRSNVDRGAYSAGREAGAGINQRGKLGGGGTRLLGS